jgi:hypothetical protein
MLENTRVREMMEAAVDMERPHSLAAVEEEEDEFTEMLLAAMVGMAMKSKRRQADVTAVMRRSKLDAAPERVAAALRTLEAQSRVRDIVPLYDGSTLATVTNIGMDLVGASRHWHFLQGVEGAAA